MMAFMNMPSSSKANMDAVLSIIRQNIALLGPSQYKDVVLPV